MAGVPNQYTDVVLLAKRNTSLDIRIRTDIKRIPYVAANTTLSAILFWGNWITAVVGEVCLHDARRTLLVQHRRMPFGSNICTLCLIEGIKPVPLGRHIVSGVEARTPNWDGGDEASMG